MLEDYSPIGAKKLFRGKLAVKLQEGRSIFTVLVVLVGNSSRDGSHKMQKNPCQHGMLEVLLLHEHFDAYDYDRVIYTID